MQVRPDRDAASSYRTTGTVNDSALPARVLRLGPDAVPTDAPHALRGVSSLAA